MLTLNICTKYVSYNKILFVYLLVKITLLIVLNSFFILFIIFNLIICQLRLIITFAKLNIIILIIENK